MANRPARQLAADLEALLTRQERLARAAKPFAFIKPYLLAAQELGEVEGLEPLSVVIAWQYGGATHAVRWEQVLELHAALKECL
jgi:hypothetical protein